METEPDTIGDLCGKRLSLDEAIEYDHTVVCDDCACVLGDEEASDV